MGLADGKTTLSFYNGTYTDRVREGKWRPIRTPFHMDKQKRGIGRYLVFLMHSGNVFCT